MPLILNQQHLIQRKLILFLAFDFLFYLLFSMHNPGVLLRDIRNIKKNSTLTLSMTSKDIGSAKELKKARSSEQLINLKGFLDVNIYTNLE